MGITVNVNSNLVDWESTSASSHAMPTSTATRTFVVDALKSFLAGATCQATATAAVIPTGIIGTVSSYSGTSLVIAPNNAVATGATLCGVFGLIWSKTTVTNGTGAKTLNVSFNPFKVNAAALTAGLAVRVHSRTAPFTNFMVGTITSFNAATGALVLNITSATGTASISDWVICQDGTFTSWDISPQWGDSFTINGAAVLSITQTPKMGLPKFVTALTNGQVQITNPSTTTMLLGYVNEPTGGNSPSNTAWRFEQNARLFVQGNFIVIGTATGAANETFAVPAGIDYPSYVEVETGVGTGVYEPYGIVPLDYDERGLLFQRMPKIYVTPNGGEISKWLFWNPATRNFETGDGTTGGVTLTSGVRVRVPNIHLSCDMTSPNFVISNVGDSAITGSVATGTGSKSFTVDTGLPYTGGGTETVQLVCPSVPGTYMNATVTTYNSGTGAMTVNVTGSNGSYTGSGWFIQDTRTTAGVITVGDWSSNSGVSTTNGRLYSNYGETISPSARSNGSFTLSQRNINKEPVASILRTNGRLWYVGDAVGGAGNASRRWQIDCAPSGTIHLENCSTHFLSLDLTDYSELNLLRCGTESIFIRSTLGSTTINRLNCSGVSSPKQYPGFRATSLVGATSLQNISVWTSMPDPAANASTCFVLSNAANVTTWNNIKAVNFYRFRSAAVMALDTLTLAEGLVPSNTYIVGNMSVTGLAGQEWDGFYFANVMNGTVNAGESGVNHLSVNRTANCIFRNFYPLGTMKWCGAAVFAGDAFSFNLIFHGCDLTANNNASGVTGMMSNSGTSNVIFANFLMGQTSTTFVNTLARATSGLVEKSLTFRRILSTSAVNTYADNTGVPYSNGLQLEHVTGVGTYWRAAPATNLPCPSYKDSKGLYTLLDPGAATGRLVVGAFAGESSSDLYDLTGTSYVNNAGLAYYEGDGDIFAVKSISSVRGVLGFRNIDPIIMDGRNAFSTSTTSVTIGTGSQTFTVSSGLAYAPGDTIIVVANTDTRNAMIGTVTSYATTSLTVNVTSTIGSGTFASWVVKSSYQATQATYEFRVCQSGEDISLAPWQALTGANLSAFTPTDSNDGFDIQFRAIGVGALVGRYLQQIVVFTDNDPAFAPPVSITPITVSAAPSGASAALIEYPDSIISDAIVGGSGTASLQAPFFADGITREIGLKVRKYGYNFYAAVVSYYQAAVAQAVDMLVDANVTQPSGTAAAHTGISLTDHGGSPVSWEGKTWGITITCNFVTNPSLTVSDIKHYLHYHLAQQSPFQGKESGLAWHNLFPMSGTETVRGFYGGSLYKGVRVVDQTGAAVVGVTRMQADDGTYYVAPTINTGTVSGFLNNTRIIVYNETKDSVEYDAIAASSPLTFTYVEGTDFEAGDVIRVYNVWYNSVDGSTATKKIVQSTTASASGWSITTDQPACTTYASYYTTFGTTGQAVYASGDFVKDGINVQIDLDDADNLWYAHRMFQWDKYQIWFNSGNRGFFTEVTASDAANLNIGSLLLDNLNAATAYQGDTINVVNATNTLPVVNPTTGGGGITMYSGGKVLTTTSGGLAPSEAQIKAWVRAELAIEMARIDVPISTRASSAQAQSIASNTGLIPALL